MTDEIILPEDPRAAVLVTETFWKSRKGNYYTIQAENVARWDGATHVHCSDCGDPTEKMYTACPACCAKRARERWRQMPKEPWDGTTPICIMGTDTYFFDKESLEDYCEENEVKAEDLLLVHCKPAKPRLLDAEDLLEECLPEGENAPADICEAIDAVNEAVKAMKPRLWYEGDKGVQL